MNVQLIQATAATHSFRQLTSCLTHRPNHFLLLQTFKQVCLVISCTAVQVKH